MVVTEYIKMASVEFGIKDICGRFRLMYAMIVDTSGGIWDRYCGGIFY